MQHEDDLGGRVKLLDPAGLDAEQKRLYNQVVQNIVPLANNAGFKSKTEDNRLIGPFNPMLFSPDVSIPFLALQKAEEDRTSLSKRARQVVILSVGSVWKASYELYAHSAVARAIGFDDKAIVSLKNGEPCAELSEDEKVAQRFALQLVKQRFVDDDLFVAAQKAFDNKGILEMLVLISCYQAVCSVLNVFEVPAPSA
jgi:4-carboxymuconolactone decarboxylase